MADRVLRDHSQPCEHQWVRRIDPQLGNDPVYGCSEAGCPGGREVTDGTLMSLTSSELVPEDWELVQVLVRRGILAHIDDGRRGDAALGEA